MRAVTYTSFGNPADVLTLGERPLPEPGAGKVRIKTTLSPIHNHDLWTTRGLYGYKPALPAIGGTEAAGTIDALGEGVTHLRIGQRVVAAGVQEAWAEYFLASAVGVVPLPDAVNDETGCQLIAMPMSALMLLESLPHEPGQWLMQNTANGAVGKTLAMLAKARGISVINLVRRDAGVNELAELGIEHAVSTEHSGWQAKVSEIIGNASIASAVDSVGGDASGELLSLLSEGGTLVSFGAMSGQPMRINSGDIIFKQATIKGFWGSKASAAASPADKMRMIGDLLRLAVTGVLKLPVEAIFDLADAGKAAAASDQPGRKGKILLRA